VTRVVRVVGLIDEVLRSVWAMMKHAMILFHHPVDAMKFVDPCRIETHLVIEQLRGLCQMRETLPVWNFDNAFSACRDALVELNRSSTVLSHSRGNILVQLSNITSVTFGSLGPGTQSSVSKLNLTSAVFTIAYANWRPKAGHTSWD
jgi:hypothetical protein